MKKISVLMLALFTVVASYGQFSIGARTGPNFSKITGSWGSNDSQKSHCVTGFMGGFTGFYGFTDQLSAVAELSFVTVGEKSKYYESDDYMEYEYEETDKYHYITLPLLVRYSFGSNFIFFGYGGLYFAYNVGGHYKTVTGDGTSEGRLRFDEDKLEENDQLFDSDESRRFDMGLNLGGGAGKDLGPGRLEADARFGYGLIDHNKFENKDIKKAAKDNGYKSFKTLYFMITVAYVIPLGEEGAKRFVD